MSIANSVKSQGPEVVRGVFGGALYQQGRGFYSALELFAIVKGSLLLEQLQTKHDLPDKTRVLPPPDQPTLYLRRAHDFARRVLAGEFKTQNHNMFQGGAEETLRALLRGLENPIPGARIAPKHWRMRHFFPYPSEMVHYDAVTRGARISVERYLFRGGGGLAHKILRTDGDSERLKRVRDGFRRLLGPSGSAVGRIANALQELDEVKPDFEREVTEAVVEDVAFRDDIEEASCKGLERETAWFEIMRRGVDCALWRPDLTDFRRVETLMHWVPFCVAMHQLAMARRTVGVIETAKLVFDAGHTKSAVRARAKRDCRAAVSAVSDALIQGARDRGWTGLLDGSQNWRKGPRSFFTTTLFAVGALNANTGHRHFTLRPAFLETVVATMVPEELPFETFAQDILGSTLGIVATREAADGDELFHVDSAALERNAELLANRLRDLGLLRDYSDATRMVGLPK